mgnify:CR=1 FL=1
MNWYYVQPDGSLLTDGWHELDGITYYFDKNGNSPRKRWVNLEDNRYYVDDTGELMKGWFPSPEHPPTARNTLIGTMVIQTACCGGEAGEPLMENGITLIQTA